MDESDSYRRYFVVINVHGGVLNGANETSDVGVSGDGNADAEVDQLEVVIQALPLCVQVVPVMGFLRNDLFRHLAEVFPRIPKVEVN